MIMSPISFWMALAFVMFQMFMQHPFIISGCLSDERGYLLDLKGGLVDPTARFSSWHGFNCCNWKGIVCDSHSSHVVALDLNNHYYYPEFNGGKIRPSLFKLKHLQYLDLGYNQFNYTPISPHFAKLNRLTFLRLSSADFAGEIPVELGNITTLRHLDLSGNGLESKRFKTWIQNLRSLEYLSMGGVNLTNESEHWGETLSSLSNLTHLDLSLCGLSGIIPPLLNVTRLSHLQLSGNSFLFQPVPVWFQNVSSLVSLDLSDCGLNGSIPSNFLHRSSMNNIELSINFDLRGNISFIRNHSSSLTVLSMEYTGVGGLIPPSTAGFQKLQKLKLGHNYLTGDTPQFGSVPGALRPLSFIDLSGNNLKGSIPFSVGRLSSLRYLILDNNQLSEAIPDSIAELVSLKVMTLSSNNLTGSISLSMFQNLTQLQELDLSGNYLTVDISSSWVPQFDQLLHLRLGSCNIQGDFPAFFSTQYSLVELDLSNNQIEGNVPNWLLNLPNLNTLNLSNNQLQGSLPPLKFTSVVVLDLHNNNFHGSIPAIYFDGDTLDLSDNKFNGSIPDTKFPLSYLSLSGNDLSGGIPHSICTDANLIQILDLSRNSLKDVIPTYWGGCGSLKVLNLAQNDLQGEMPEELGNLTGLETLNVNGNNLQGTIPSAITNCAFLKVFDIGHNQIQGTIPVWFKGLTQLRILSLSFNKFHGSIPPELIELQNLQVLDLSHNNLTGTIPTNLGKLSAMINQSQSVESQHTEGIRTSSDTPYTPNYFPTFMDQITLWIKGRELQYPKIWRSFKFMDLSHNKLSGDIPVEMGLLEGLIALNISKNNLSGSIPKSLEGMVHLESLDLSGNVLSGKIPAELVSLTFLSVLNLSDNMLSGLIPQGKQFSTFGASSFVGNPNLHGFPLENGTQSSGVGERGSHVAGVDEDGVGEADEMEKWWEVAVGLCYNLWGGIRYCDCSVVLPHKMEIQMLCCDGWYFGISPRALNLI